MKVTVIKKSRLNVFELPPNIEGNYWITDFENGRKINLINIEARDNEWILISNHDVYALNGENMMIPEVTLKDYGFYLIKNNYRNEKYYIYCSPIYDKTYQIFSINSDKVTIGSDESVDICYGLSSAVPKKAFTITKSDKYYHINIIDNTTNVYLNNKRVIKTTRIEYGDILFIYGLKIILMRKDGKDILLVNNPNNLLKYNVYFSNLVSVEEEFVEDYEELSEDMNTNETNYFYRTPHFYKTIQKYIVNLDIPPQKKEEDKTPAILTVGPMLTMSMTSVITMISTVNSMQSGEASLKDSTTSLVMCGVMLASTLLWPMLTKGFQKMSNKMYESKRQKLYRKYINKKEQEIVNELEIQRKTLIENTFSVEECQNVIRAHNIRLWQRRITDEDFLNLPVGIGNIKMDIDIKYPEEHFSMSQDNLLEIAQQLGKKERILKDVPVLFSFYNNFITGIVGDPIYTKEFIDRLVLQIMANYSYDEVKIVTLTSIDNELSWNYMKSLPHSWSNDKTIRYFGSANDNYREIIYNLEKVYNEKIASKNDSGKEAPYYIIVTDAIKSIDSYDFIKKVMASDVNCGFSIIMAVDKLSALPNECKNFINVSNEECTIFSSVLNGEVQKFKIDFSSIEEIDNCATELANIPINIKTENELSLPDTFKFLEMYQVGKVEQLNSKDRWSKNSPMLSLQAPVGISKSGDLINLDLHEKYHGPHGLVAGTTGSGKSEFIITYILSLAVNYHPYEVQIILIDYKGGSLAGAFANDKYSLPHLAGTITNLDGNELNRTLVSIESEIKRRQREFNKAREVANESTMDIYKYQKLWREGKLKDMDPISHLFIISDEFAELKEQQPDFMDSLISTARVGRSLGVHLILATQKPGGVVDAQIWSNTKFRVCLKVQDAQDSQEILKKPDAAFLKKTGRFYLQVGYDEVYILGQSAWAGGQYYPDNTYRVDIDTSVNAIDNIGYVTNTKDVKKNVKKEAMGEELQNVVKYLSDLAKEENIKIRKLWLEKIPAFIKVDNIIEKYNFVKKSFFIDIPIGEYDDPSSQNQYLLTIPFTKLGNAIIYGIAGAGKELFLTSLIYSAMKVYSPEEINFYVMDFGAETLRMFQNAPHVCDIVYLNETDKINNLFKLIKEELEYRRNLFGNYNGNYQSYIKAENTKKIPNIVVVINNFEAFSESYEEFSDVLNQIVRDAFKYGIFFVLTTSSENGVRMKTKQSFSLIYALQQNQDMDYSSILGNTRGKTPSKIKGRGLFKRDEIFEFQTAMPCEEENISTYIQGFCQEYNSKINYVKRKIPMLPKVVDFEFIKDSLTKSSNMVVGVNKNNLNIETYNFNKSVINLISAYELEDLENFTNAFISQVVYNDYYELAFVNTTDIEITAPEYADKIYDSHFDDIILKYSKYINAVYERYEISHFNDKILKNEKHHMLVIYGINDFINKLSDEAKSNFEDLMKKNSQLLLLSIVIIDNPDVIKNFAYEDWFKTNVDLSRGFWIGRGLTDQTLFKISKYGKEEREEIDNEYGYIISSSKAIRIKVLEEFFQNIDTL